MALDHTQPPRVFTIKVAADGVCPQLRLPDDVIGEADIVAYVAATAKSSEYRCNLSWNDLKQYWFKADESYALESRRPVLEITESTIIIADAGVKPIQAVA